MAEGKVKCQRIGCDAYFTEEDNANDSCRYHASGPIFHDGMKEWSCCKKRSHDFSLFLEIPGCQTGKHSTEKPVLQVAATKSTSVAPLVSPPTVSTDDCSRCKQGFFCSDHGSQTKQAAHVKCDGDLHEPSVSSQPKAHVRQVIDINEPQRCKNSGCDKTFKELENHETACSYHPGPAVFHDRSRGWKCCDIHVKEFEEFMAIPPCCKGWHNASPS